MPPALAEGDAADPVSQGIPVDSIQGKSLFCCGSHTLEHCGPQGELHTLPLGLPKGPKDLALPVGLRPQRGNNPAEMVD